MISVAQNVGAVSSNALDIAGVSSKQFPSLTGPKQKGSEFGDLFRDAVGQVNELEKQAQAAVDGLLRGSGVDVHQAMIATEKANMAFELALAMRNKAVQCYQSVMSMQF